MKLLSLSLFNRFVLVALAISITACGGQTKKEADTQKSESRATISQADSMSAPTAKLNMNTASGKEFKTIPKVGEKMEHEFKEYRPYVSIQQFRKEIGKYVDAGQVAAYEKYIYVPIKRNKSDAATLMQIPGLQKENAQKLVDNRPYKSNQAFFDALSSYLNEDQMAKAKTYTTAN